MTYKTEKKVESCVYFLQSFKIIFCGKITIYKIQQNKQKQKEKKDS